MKKIITAAGLVAIGAMGISNVQAQSKPWSVSASLRGFYDDNYATAPTSAAPGTIGKRGSFGTDVGATAAYNLSTDQTALGLKYTFGMRYYEDRTSNSADYSHQADVSLDHKFSEIYSLTASDSFAIAQEPGIIDPSGVTTNPLRSDGNNLRNNANISFSAQLTPTYSTEITYSNTYYDYQQSGPASRSALLDRDENLIGLNLRAQIVPTFVGLVGYQFGLINQDSKDSLLAPPAAYLDPKVRDNRSHYFFVGGDYNLTQELIASGRFGVQYIEYPNAVPGSRKDAVNPYVDFKITYTYTKDSYATLGVVNKHAQTDIVSGAVPTLDQEATSVYFNINHKITAKLTGSLNAQAQNSAFNGGAANNSSEQYYTIGVNVKYEINKFLSAETGYNYDRLDSDLPNRSFYRDRVYLGITATY